MPDFDVDFCYERRQEVIDYVNRKYGADHVAQIVTFGTMAARNAIRDVGRVMGMPYQSVDVVAKQVPMELKMTLKRALEVSPELKRMYDSDPQVTELIDTALKVEGMPRHASTHAASRAGILLWIKRKTVPIIPAIISRTLKSTARAASASVKSYTPSFPSSRNAPAPPSATQGRYCCTASIKI